MTGECGWCDRPARRRVNGYPVCPRHERGLYHHGDPHGTHPHGVSYALQPLLDALADDAGPATVERVAAVVGCNSAWVRAWRVRGLGIAAADRAAVAAGLHPATVWPDWAADVDVARPLDPAGFQL